MNRRCNVGGWCIKNGSIQVRVKEPAQSHTRENLCWSATCTGSCFCPCCCQYKLCVRSHLSVRSSAGLLGDWEKPWCVSASNYFCIEVLRSVR
uniref:Uncharacterized protein n=1 Tax=Anguilla anguilla TaxID=7936 RepID=A0A0E9XZB2_ANGAN